MQDLIANTIQMVAQFPFFTETFTRQEAWAVLSVLSPIGMFFFASRKKENNKKST